MRVALLRVDFLLGGCRSLKEKRQRLKGIRDRYGRASNVAVCESEYQGSLRRAQWCFVATADSAEVVTRALSDIERNLQLGVDAQLIDVQREWLV